VEADAMAYWDALPDKDAMLPVTPAYWGSVQTQLSGSTHLFTSESTLTNVIPGQVQFKDWGKRRHGF
jgi:hypothetical protein